MKNIHLLPTEKPSRLFKDDFGGLFYSINIDQEQNHFEPQNIYITSDEEIKEGDWCYYLNILGGGNIVCQAYKHSGDKRMLFDDGTYNRKIGEGITPLIGECKKIILTTDQDLIKDGVQAIDDEFLEWFVKNPSCDRIDFVLINDIEPWYKIRFPKEETKQETLEEASENKDEIIKALYELSMDLYFCVKGNDKRGHCGMMGFDSGEKSHEDLSYLGGAIGNLKQSFDIIESINRIKLDYQDGIYYGIEVGTKWREERMYSEEEVKFIERLINFYWAEHNSEHPSNLKDFELSKNILENFKKNNHGK